MPYQKVRGGYTTKRGGFLRDTAQYEALRRKGMSKEQAARIVNKLLSTPTTPAQIKRRKREAAVLGTTTAIIGLGTLGARGAEGALKQIPKFKKSPMAQKVASHLHSSQQTALVVNAGLGGVGGLNYAAVNRAEGRIKQKQQAKGPLVKSDEFAPFGVVHKGLAQDTKMGFRGLKAGIGGWNESAAHGAAMKQGQKIGAKTRSVMNTTNAYGHSFNAGFSRKVGRTDTARTVHSAATFKAGHLTRMVGVPTAVLGGSYAAGSELGRRGVRKAYNYNPEAERHRRTGFYSGVAAAGTGALAGGAAHQGTKAVKSGLAAKKKFQGAQKMAGKNALRDVKFANAEVGALATHATRASGRAILLAGGAGALVGGYHHIKNKTKVPAQQGAYHGYY